MPRYPRDFSTGISYDRKVGDAALAQCKGRRGLNWFLVSIFLGPLATFILLFMEKIEP